VGTRGHILGKVLQALLTLAFVMAFNFFLFRMIPGDAEELLLQGTTEFDPPNVEQVTQDLGLDEPLPQQFLIYVQDTLTLKFGNSFSLRGQDVKLAIYQRIWPTLLLVATSSIASAMLGLLSVSTAGGGGGADSMWRRRGSRCSSTRCRSSGSGF
jgi:peptide/nickel transport system permease protein